jgi:hypothetical protein
MAAVTTLPAAFVANTVLTADQLNNVRGAFRVLQSLFTSTTTSATSASTTYVTTNLSQIITPSSSSSKVKIQANILGYRDTNGGELGLRIVRTIAGTPTTLVTIGQAATGNAAVGLVPIQWVDEPATTAATTYTVHFARSSGTGNVVVQQGAGTSTMVVEEISA